MTHLLSSHQGSDPAGDSTTVRLTKRLAGCRSRRRTSLLVAVLLAVLLAGVVPGGTLARLQPAAASSARNPGPNSTTTTSTPGAATSLSIAVTPGTDIARATWTRPTGVTSTTDVTRLYLVDVTVPSAWTIAQQATCYVRDVCDQAVNLRGLVSGRTYMLAVQGVNGVGAGPLAWSNPFSTSPSCPVDVCVTVDATTAATSASKAPTNKATGMLGNFMVPADVSLLDDLHPTWWRLTTFGLPDSAHPPAYQAFDKARNRGATIIENLSADWWQQVRDANGGKMPKPSADWAAWDSFVTAKVRQSIADGRNPDYWDVWNEPEGGTNVIGGGFTTSEQLALYARTWKDIRSVDPHAKVAYAASTQFAARSNPTTNVLGLLDLIDYVKAKHLTLDAYTYHDGTPVLYDSMSPFADEIIDRVGAARKWLDAAHMTSTKIVIDEFIPPATYGIPAANLAYLSAIERSSADGAARACWDRTWPLSAGTSTTASGCLLGQLDNLTDLDGNFPLAAWWVQEAYADLSGQLAPATSTSSWVQSLAAVRPDGTTTVLLGRYATCTADIWSLVNPACPSTKVSWLPATVQVKVKAPSAGRWTVSVDGIPNVISAVTSLVQSLAPNTATTDSNGDLTVTVPIADGAVQQITLTPAS
ncbi:MAG TPA: hypothetical protein VHA73_13305 [Acidimicrobiales bacterium]|nr:hypothetical protein [Acidimicrobiales bacterium]